MLFHKKIKKERVANAFFSWRKHFPPISCKLYNKVGNKRFLSPRINHSLYSLFLPPFLTSYDHNLPLPPLRHLFPFLSFFFFFWLWFFHMEVKNIKIKISDERGINEITLIMEYKNLFMAFKENMFFFPCTSGTM